MPIIEVQAAATVTRVLVGAGDPLGVSVERAVATAAGIVGGPLHPTKVMRSNEQTSVDWGDVCRGGTQEGRLVGSSDYTVLAAPSGTLMEMLQSVLQEQAVAKQERAALKQELAAMEQQMAAHIAPRVRNAAAQMLLHASGAQSFRVTTSSHYGQMLAASDLQLQQLAEGMDMTAADVARQADGVITRRNQHTHPGSRVAFDKEVSELQGLITPELEKLCPDECRFLLAYEVVKRTFPTRFV